MNTVSGMESNGGNNPKTTSPPPKGNGGVAGFLNYPFLGGAGDASLSPRVSCEHTPSLSLGAVRGHTVAPQGGKVCRQAARRSKPAAGILRAARAMSEAIHTPRRVEGSRTPEVKGGSASARIVRMKAVFRTLPPTL